MNHLAIYRPKIYKELLQAVYNLREAYTVEELQRHFQTRTLDPEFEEIGRLVLDGRRQQPPYVYVWVGYLVVTNSNKNQHITI